jgi:site-specific recombinase XerD
MSRKSFTVLFFLRKGKLLKNGEAPICVRITVNGRPNDILIKRSASVNLWDQAKEKIRGSSRTAMEINRYIESVRMRLYQIYRELEEAGKCITSNRIKDIYTGKGEMHKTLLQVFAEHNEQCRQLINKDFVFKTVQRYETTARYLGEFMQSKYGVPDIALDELKPAFVHDFETFLKVEKGCAHNSAITRLKNLKKIIGIALENDWLKKSPFIGIKFKIEETHPEFLTMDEIQRILTKEIDVERVAQVRDVFVFCLFTGLAFSDVQQLTQEHFVRNKDGELWIRKTRQKTKVMCDIPLLPVPLQLIEKYKEHPYCLRTGKIFPVPSNQKMNAYLKEVADLCGIHKKLTTHTARHSFATSVSLANGVSMENVARMLGHKDTTITKHYARVLDSSILRDMKHVKQVLSELGTATV